MRSPVLIQRKCGGAPPFNLRSGVSVSMPMLAARGLRALQLSLALREQAFAAFLIVDDAGHFQHDWKVADHKEQQSVAV